ncbi:MAG: dockerin type I repeat-containing protein [Prevotella sp.]|nr:dockerin type I repeat-containing protein [Prevotella sp.]
MKQKLLLMLSLVLWGVGINRVLANESPSVTVIENLESYTGSDAYVFNKADGKVYVLNNLNEYELYGVYQKTSTLKVAGGGDTDIAYIETTSKMDPVPYINTGYVHKSTTRIVAEVAITAHTRGWEAVFGARQNGFGDHAFVLFSRAFDTRDTGVFNRSGKEEGFSADIPLNKRIVIDASGLQADVYNYNDLTTPIASCTSTGRNDDGTNAMFIFDTNTAGANDARPDNSSSKMQLFSFKIYEDEELVMDLQPIVTPIGEVGLRDKVSGKKFFSARENVSFAMSPDGEAAANEAGITVYEGKMVFNTTDGKVYKYTNGAFVEVGERTLEAIDNTDYKNMKNWRSNEEHWNNVYGNGDRIGYDEATGVNTFNPYKGTGGWEPLFYKLGGLEANADYNIAFDYSTGGWNSWSSFTTLPFLVLKNEGFDHGKANGSGTIFALAQLPNSETTNQAVSVDFMPDQDFAMLVVQFGVVNDGIDFNFEFANWQVSKYVYPETYPVVNPFGPLLVQLIPEAEACDVESTEALMNALKEAIEAAKAVVDGDDLAAQKTALENLQKALDDVKNNDVTILKQTVELAKAEGVDVTSQEEFLVTGTTGLNDQLNSLRVARKVAHLETDEAAYEGNEPAAGEFYLLNVGRKAYLTSGSDWGTHAALGYPGLLATLAENGEGYTIQFNELIPGDARDKFLGGSPYVDGWDGDKGTYVFEPVEGKPGVYAIKGNRGYLAFDPDGEVDGGGVHHFNTVTATWETPGNPDAEWMLITKDDRLALMDEASEENPVDVTVIISDASFNKYAALDNPWNDLEQGWGWGDRNFGDKNTETFNSQEYDLSQRLFLPMAGKYVVSVQAYYRDGDINAHAASVAAGDSLVQAPVLYAGDATQPLKYIHEEADKAPGEGTNTVVGNFPDNMMQAAAFFQNGLYWNSVECEVDSTNTDLVIGIRKLAGNREKNWIVADNFRIVYLGSGESTAPIKGDVNGDGEVGIGDIVSITNVMAGIETNEAIIKAANVNGDNEVGIGDIVTITNIMAGIEEQEIEK